MSERIIAADLAARLDALPPGRRLVGIAGAPASGKSTLAEALVERANARRSGSAAVLPMDGYHLDDRVLEARGHRPRKGAPHTFDVGGLRHMLIRLRENADPEIAIPVFDRDIEIARAGAAIIPREVDLIVAEGNYLLLDRDPWTTLDGLFDLTVLVDTPEDTLRERLTARWEGYAMTPEQIRAKLEENDLPNGRLVSEASRAPDLMLADS